MSHNLGVVVVGGGGGGVLYTPYDGPAQLLTSVNLRRRLLWPAEILLWLKKQLNTRCYDQLCSSLSTSRFLVLPNCARKILEVAEWNAKKLLPEFQKFNGT